MDSYREDLGRWAELEPDLCRVLGEDTYFLSPLGTEVHVPLSNADKPLLLSALRHAAALHGKRLGLNIALNETPDREVVWEVSAQKFRSYGPDLLEVFLGVYLDAVAYLTAKDAAADKFVAPRAEPGEDYHHYLIRLHDAYKAFCEANPLPRPVPYRAPPRTGNRFWDYWDALALSFERAVNGAYPDSKTTLWTQEVVEAEKGVSEAKRAYEAAKEKEARLREL